MKSFYIKSFSLVCLTILVFTSQVMLFSPVKHTEVYFNLRMIRGRQQVTTYPEESVFIPVSSPRLEVGDMPQELRKVANVLEAHLREQGFGFALDYFKDNIIHISLREGALSIEAPKLLERVRVGEWIVIEQQLVTHGRDLQFTFATREEESDELKVITMVIKGAGRRMPMGWIGFDIAYQRPFYISPSSVLQTYWGISREKVEEAYVQDPEKYRFNTYSFIGGMDYEYAVAEYRRSLAIHRLLLELDGEPAGIPIYTGINIIREIPIIRDNELVTVSTEEFLTSPDILHKSELLTIAYELRERIRTDVRVLRTVERYLDLLWSDDYGSLIADESNAGLMRSVRNLVRREMLLTTLTKWETSNFRVSNLSHEDELILEYIRLIYGVEEWTEDSLHQVIDSFTHSIARTLGAIHGAGGVLSNDSDLVSSVVSKDISLSGEMQDFMDSSYIPFFGADPILSEIDLDSWQSRDIILALESIYLFCDGLISLISNFETSDLNYQSDISIKKVYHEYYRKAQEYMQTEGR